jgi:hypothetical protein
MEEKGQQNQAMESQRKWYNSYKFPLIPVIETHKPNQYNTWRIHFNWLFIRFWTLDSFQFELAFVASSHWGIGIIGIFPYLRWTLTIPCPWQFELWLSKNLDRKPKEDI